MFGNREAGEFFRGFVIPLLLIAVGGGLLTLGRSTDSSLLGYTGVGLLAIGGLWMLISCFRNGIDIFDLW